MTRPVEDLADDFVLGLLDQDEMTQVEGLIATDEAMARAVGRARDRFVALDLTAAPVELPPGFSARIGAALAAAGPAAAAPARRAANLPVPPRRWLSAAAAALALVLGIGLGTTFGTGEPVIIAVLLDDAGRPRAMVEDFGNSTARIRFLSEVEVPQGQVMEVWTLPSVQRGPVSLGLITAPRSVQLIGPDLPLPADSQLYEITLEPAGGSPTGRPTGPLLAKGFAAPQI